MPRNGQESNGMNIEAVKHSICYWHHLQSLSLIFVATCVDQFSLLAQRQFFFFFFEIAPPNSSPHPHFNCLCCPCCSKAYEVQFFWRFWLRRFLSMNKLNKPQMFNSLTIFSELINHSQKSSGEIRICIQYTEKGISTQCKIDVSILEIHRT